jgi:hypothetical protein
MVGEVKKEEKKNKVKDAFYSRVDDECPEWE